MSLSTEEPVVDEAIWRAWVQRGRQREQAFARHLKTLSGILAILLALGGGVYFFAMR